MVSPWSLFAEHLWVSAFQDCISSTVFLISASIKEIVSAPINSRRGKGRWSFPITTSNTVLAQLSGVANVIWTSVSVIYDSNWFNGDAGVLYSGWRVVNWTLDPKLVWMPPGATTIKLIIQFGFISFAKDSVKPPSANLLFHISVSKLSHLVCVDRDWT